MVRSTARRQKRVASDDEEDSDTHVTKTRQKPTEEVDSDGEGEAQHFDPTTFKDQPLDPAQAAQKLEGLNQDWEAYASLFSDLYTGITTGAETVQECLADQDEDVSCLNWVYVSCLLTPNFWQMSFKVDIAMRNLVDAEAQMKIQKKIISGLIEQVQREAVVSQLLLLPLVHAEVLLFW